MRSDGIVAMLCVVVTGCSTTFMISSPEKDESQSFSEFNEFSSGRQGTVFFLSDTSLNAQDISAGPDSTSLVVLETYEKKVVATTQIKEIVFKNHGLGAFEGFGLGLLSGGAVGVLSAVIAVGSPHGLEGLAYIYLPAIGGALGSLVGVGVGANSGHTSRYVFAGSTHEFPEPAVSNMVTVQKSSTKTDAVYLKSGLVVRGTIKDVVIEKPFSKALVRYVRRGTIDRAGIVVRLQEGGHITHVAIRTELGEDGVYEASEIERIELAD